MADFIPWKDLTPEQRWEAIGLRPHWPLRYFNAVAFKVNADGTIADEHQWILVGETRAFLDALHTPQYHPEKGDLEGCWKPGTTFHLSK